MDQPLHSRISHRLAGLTRQEARVVCAWSRFEYLPKPPGGFTYVSRFAYRLKIGSLWGWRGGFDVPVAAIILAVMRIKEKVEGEKQRFRIASEPKIKKRDRKNRQGKDQPDGQVQTEIQHQINDQTEQRSHAVVDGEDGEQEISGFAFERVSAAWATVERHKPISQSSHPRPRYKQRSFTARWAFQAEGVRHHPTQPFH